MVEEKQTERGSEMECRLHPEDVSPSRCIGVCHAACSQDTHSKPLSAAELARMC